MESPYSERKPDAPSQHKELYQVSELGWGLSHYCSASSKRCQVNLMKKSCSYKSSGHIYANIRHLGACTRERRIESNQKNGEEAWRDAHQFRACTALAGVLGLIPIGCLITTVTPVPQAHTPSSDFNIGALDTHMMHSHTFRQNAHTHKIT